MPLDPTSRLLIELARVRSPPSPPSALAQVQPGRLLAMAGRLGNFSLIARRYLALDPGLDARLVAQVERNLAHYEMRERLSLADVRDLAADLTAAGEPLVILKGAAYSRWIYPERGLRSYQDVDVLVRPQAVAAAERILVRLGYHRRHAIEGSIEMVRTFGGSGVGLCIELHTQLIHHENYPHYRARIRLREAELIERAEERTLDGQAVRVLRAEDELVYSVLHHFLHHDLVGLKYHSDLDALLGDRERPLDVEAAIARARAMRADRIVGLTLLVSKKLFGAGVIPERLLDALAPTGLRRRALERLLPPLAELPLLEHRVAGHPVKVLTTRGAWASGTLALRWLFPGRRYLEPYYGVAGGRWNPAYHLRYASAILAKAARWIGPQT